MNTFTILASFLPHPRQQALSADAFQGTGLTRMDGRGAPSTRKHAVRRARHSSFAEGILASRQMAESA